MKAPPFPQKNSPSAKSARPRQKAVFHLIILVYRKLYSVVCQAIPASKPCKIKLRAVTSEPFHTSNLLQAFSRQLSPTRQSLSSIPPQALTRELPQLYAVGFAGFGSLSAMTFIRLSVHLIGSANFASPITASLASSAGFRTPPRTSSTTAYL